MDYITESLEILAQGVPKPQLKESNTSTSSNKDWKPKQAQNLPCYKNIPKQGNRFNNHEW